MHGLFLHFRQQKSMDKLSNNLLRLYISAPTTKHASSFQHSHFSQNFIIIYCTLTKTVNVSDSDNDKTDFENINYKIIPNIAY